MSSNTVKMVVSGHEFQGWTDVKITIDLNSIVRHFEIGMTRKPYAEAGEYDQIKIGQSTAIYIGKDVVLTGYVTEIEEDWKGNSHTIKVKGSSKTIDLVECTIPDGKPLEYKDQTIAQAIKVLAGYYDINVVDHIKNEDRHKLEVNLFETIKNAFDKWLKEYSFLLTDSEKGELIITSVGLNGHADDSVTLGKNVLQSKKVQKHKSLFRRYVVYGQSANALSESGSSSNQLIETAEDPNVRYRVKAIDQSGSAAAINMQNRAALYRDVAKASSTTLTYTLNGWRQSSGKLWRPNMIVEVLDLEFGVILDEYLIKSVVFSMNSAGLMTVLELVPPEAFTNTTFKSSIEAVKGQVANVNGVKVSSAEWTQS